MSIGDSYDPIGIHLLDPYPLYERARREEPVFYSPVLQAWVVTRYDDVVTVLRDPETYSSADPFTRVVEVSQAAQRELMAGYPPFPDLIQSDGELHAWLRAPIAAVLKPDRVKALEPYVREQARTLVEGFAADGEVEFMRSYAEPLPRRTIGRLCGLDEEQSRAVYDAMSAFVLLGSVHMTQEEEVEAARAGVRLQRMLGELVRERYARPGPDAISEITAYHAEGGELTYAREAQTVANLMQLVIAGHITTVPMLGNAVTLLLTHREQWERLCADPTLIPGAVEELLRYGTPASGLYRDTTRDTELGGVRLPKGSRVVLRYNSANRDQAHFHQAETFDITRKPSRHLSFGLGTHYCLGAPLARKTLAITLETLTTRLPGLRLASPVDLRPIYDIRHPIAVHLIW